MVTEARKRANAKWDKENMVVLACKVKRETAEQFKAACAAQGTTSNAVLQQAVKTFLDEHPAPEQPHAARNAPDDDTEARPDRPRNPTNRKTNTPGSTPRTYTSPGGEV